MNGNFKDTFSDYESYVDGDLYYTKVPPGVVSALKGLILRVVEDEHSLKVVCNDVASRIPYEPTKNWGWNFLLTDLDYLIDELSRKRLPKLMDFICDFANKNYEKGNFLDDLNEIFEEYDFGYRLRLARGLYSRYSWELIQEPDQEDKAISTTVEEVRDICQQAKDHLEQARNQLQKTDNLRAWKDALRDCLSAMEALVNQLGGDTDINKSTRALRSDGRWGHELVVKDGLSIWNRMHDLYPDIRHGNHAISSLSREEALYWIDRLMAFVCYMVRRKKLFKNE